MTQDNVNLQGDGACSSGTAGGSAALQEMGAEAPATRETEHAPGRCLNCGDSLTQDMHFCPRCGQPADTGRLSSKDLALYSLGTLTRLNKGVFFTCLNLLCRPWKVIAGYIHGQRVTYTDPVKLLIGLCFMLLALMALFGLEDSDYEVAMFNDPNASPLVHILKFFLTSTTLQYLLVFLPVAPVIMLTNRRDRTSHYNFAECFAGALYMSDAVLIIELLCLPLLAMGWDVSNMIGFTYLAVMGSVIIYKSLSHYGFDHKRRLAKTAQTILMILLSYFLLLVLLTIIVATWMIISERLPSQA